MSGKIANMSSWDQFQKPHTLNFLTDRHNLILYSEAVFLVVCEPSVNDP